MLFGLELWLLAVQTASLHRSEAGDEEILLNQLNYSPRERAGAGVPWRDPFRRGIMSVWLQKRLVLWLSSALLLLLIGFRVMAQVEYAEYAPPTTATEAAQLFGRLVQNSAKEDQPTADNYLGYRLISHYSQRQLGWRATFILLEELDKQQMLDLRIGAKRQENGRIIVDTQPKSYPTVFVAEAGGYRVDLVATFAKRLRLGEPSLQETIYSKTGIALDRLPGKDTSPMRQTICQSNLREIAIAVAQYSEDYDERLPLAKSWSSDLQPYGPREAMYYCPALPKGKLYGYAYNSKLSAKGYAVWSKADTTPLLYETATLAGNAYGIGENLAFRHESGANYAFMDGHVKWYPEGKAPNFVLKRQSSDYKPPKS